RTLATVIATTITSIAFSLSSNRHSTGSEDSVNTGSQQSSLTAAITRLTPIPDRLRVRTNGNAAASSSSSLSQPAVASRLIKSKTRVSVAKKRGRTSENEENDENNDDTSVLHDAAASRNGISMKAVSYIDMMMMTRSGTLAAAATDAITLSNSKSSHPTSSRRPRSQ
ncbi:unnamed protein product, partial [Rotaria sp. Silwood2]